MHFVQPIARLLANFKPLKSVLADLSLWLAAVANVYMRIACAFNPFTKHPRGDLASTELWFRTATSSPSQGPNMNRHDDFKLRALVGYE
jgi:hypothetical protein